MAGWISMDPSKAGLGENENENANANANEEVEVEVDEGEDVRGKGRRGSEGARRWREEESRRTPTRGMIS